MIITTILVYILANYADKTEAKLGRLNIRATIALLVAMVLALGVGVEMAAMLWHVFN